MHLTQDQLLESSRKLVERFLAKHYAEETVYLPLFWDKFIMQVSETGNIAFTPQEENKASRIQFLSFAREKKLNLVTPFAIMIVSAVLREMNVETSIPTVKQIGNAIRKCAIELGAPRKLINQMGQSIAQSLSEAFRQARESNLGAEKIPPEEEKQVISISPSKPVTINGEQIEIHPHQPFVVFCEFVRRQRLHWAHGFVLFETWCRFPKPNPRRRFETIINRLNKALREAGAMVKVEAEKVGGLNTGFSDLVIPSDIQLVGDIREARHLYESARQLFDCGGVDKSILALQKSFRKDADAVETVLLLAKAVRIDIGGSFDNEVLRCVWSKLQQREVRMHQVISLLTEQGENEGWRKDWEPVYMLKSQFEDELRKVSEARIVIDMFLHKKGTLSQEDIEFRKVSDLVNRIRDAKDYYTFIKPLCEFNTVKDVFEIARGKLTRIFKQFDISELNRLESIMLSVFAEEICRGGKHPEDYGTLARLRNSWISELSRKTGENMLEEFYSIDKVNQRKLREYGTALKKIGQCHSEPLDSDILNKLGRKWDVERLNEARAIERQMASLKESIDIEGYWRLFIKRPPRKC